MRYSGHKICLLKMIEDKGLDGSLRVVEMNPPDMASALTTGALDAYFVGEPFAIQTVLSGDATVVSYAESLWPNFICNLVLVKNSWLNNNRSAARKLVETAARSGLWAGRHPNEAAQIVADYWNQSVELVRHALTNPNRPVIFDRFVPHPAELQEMADLMVRYELIPHADITGLVDNRFALAASIKGIDDLDDLLRD
jgi:NitT/TauT family transport system substrate-binding protein